MKGNDGLWWWVTILIVSNVVLAEDSASFEDQPHGSSVYTRHVKSGTKPKKYKCILVDDDDENPGQNVPGGTSYVSELQQRRLQAAAQIFSEKTQVEPQQHRVSTPILTRTINSQQHLPTRVISTTNNQNSRTGSGSSFGLPRAEEFSVAGLKNKPLKQITLTRPSTSSQQNTVNTQPEINYKPIYKPQPPTTTAQPTMKLSQEYCNMIRQYAALYNVQDVLGWVSKNCAFAKQYLPNATCAEINTLVASCYRFFNKS